MPSYQAPLDDIRFVLFDYLQIDQHTDLPGFADVTRETVDDILKGGAAIAEGVLHPLNRIGDEEGCHLENGVVRTPPGFADAYRTFCEGGWNRLSMPEAYGGFGLPGVIGMAVNEMMTSANQAFSMYVGLTGAASASLMGFAPDEIKRNFIPKMVAGTWTGTMNLTEPHCGTDLRLMKTKAVEQADGTYRVSGTKIYISGGDHDLTENIAHMVLAKVPDGDGKIHDDLAQVNLFLVPKFLVNADGSLGARNGVTCTAIERKMGIKGNATAVLVYEDAIGYRIGPKPETKASASAPEAASSASAPKSRGMAGMFAMMNMARLGVGFQGMAQAEVAYQNAAQYARDRLQARSISGVKNPELAADPIIVHPDIRRMLLNARSFIEGARALGLWLAMENAKARGATDEATRTRAQDLGDLLTPVIKAFFTDMGFESTNAAMQCFGGAGYVRDTGMEQFVRDSRILQIYEGTNGVQALDLVGRKLSAKGGRAAMALFQTLHEAIDRHGADERLAEFTRPLKSATDRLQRAAMWFASHARANPDDAGAGSVDFLRMTGITVLALTWLELAATAYRRLDEIAAGAAGHKDFYSAKLVCARHWMERMVPETAGLVERIEAGSTNLMHLDAAAF
jgi:alkylation response protein AidB-like acyl-CoA dehydrogenase